LSVPPPQALEVPLSGTAAAAGAAGVKEVLLRSTLRLQSDEKLVELLRQGHAAAFDVMVERYRLPLTRYCARMVGPDNADDIVQETFTASYSALGSDDRPIQLKPWLYRVAHNTAISALRKKSRHDHEELDENFDGVRQPHDHFEQSQRLHDLVANMRALPERQRTAIVLQELEGMSPEQIAEELDGSVPMVRQLVHRARERLRNGVGMLIPLPLILKLFSPGNASAATGKSAGTAALSGKSGGATFAGVGVTGSGAKLGIILAVGAIAAGGVAVQKVVLQSGAGHPGKEIAGTTVAGGTAANVTGGQAGGKVSKAGGTAVAGKDAVTPRSEPGKGTPADADHPAADSNGPADHTPSDGGGTQTDPSPAPRKGGDAPSSDGGGSGPKQTPASDAPSGGGSGGGSGGDTQPSDGGGSQPSGGGDTTPSGGDSTPPSDGGSTPPSGGGGSTTPSCKPVLGIPLPLICLK
jgi:RNA polymerase sigma factor (sigma-70 family)